MFLCDNSLNITIVNYGITLTRQNTCYCVNKVVWHIKCGSLIGSSVIETLKKTESDLKTFFPVILLIWMICQ